MAYCERYSSQCTLNNEHLSKQEILYESDGQEGGKTSERQVSPLFQTSIMKLELSDG